MNKITWAHVGLVTEAGRYLFKFGWLTITTDDLAIWNAHPKAIFTLIRTTALAGLEGDQQTDAEEFRLGTFDLRDDLKYSDSER